MKIPILTICNFGKNRSRYLAEYLAQKGYDTDYAGIGEGSQNPVTQEKVDWAQVIVVVKEWMKEELEKRFDVSEKRVIALDVDNHADVLSVELKKQMDPYLPL